MVCVFTYTYYFTKNFKGIYTGIEYTNQMLGYIAEVSLMGIQCYCSVWTKIERLQPKILVKCCIVKIKFDCYLKLA